MYIIENGSAYLIDGNKAYKIKFDLNKNMTFDKENAIDVEGHQKYTYDEVLKKLNIEYNIEIKKQELTDKANESIAIKELNAKIAELTKNNDELVKKIAELTKVDESKEVQNKNK